MGWLTPKYPISDTTGATGTPPARELIWVKLAAGGDDCPLLSSPQHSTAPPGRIPQL